MASQKPKVPRSAPSGMVQVSDSSKPVADTESQWTLQRVFLELGTHEDCIVFCEEQGLVPMEKMCSYHKRPMKVTFATTCGQLGVFKCTNSRCRTKPVSRAMGTWFEQVRLELPIVFEIMYLFSHGASYDDVQRETFIRTRPVVSSKTIAEWYSHCREAIIIYELENQIYKTKIGGPNKIVVIDGANCGKRKYDIGKSIEDRWILGMVEKGGEDIRLEVCPDKKRSQEVLVRLIRKHVAKGSIVQTDSWKGYECLPKYGYIHKKVKYRVKGNSRVAPDGTPTRRTERQWRGLKRRFQKDKCKKDFLDWLAEFSWRRKNRIYNKDPFEELLKAVKYLYGSN